MKKVKFLLILIQLIFFNITYAQKSLYEKKVEFDINNVVGIAHKLVEIVDDSLLLVGGPLSDFYLYNINNQSLVKSVELNSDWNKPFDLIQSKDGKLFIICYDWGLLIMNRDLKIVRKIKSKGSQLHEIKRSKKGTVWQRTEEDIREIDIQKGKIVSTIKIQDFGEDLEIDENENLMISSSSSLLRMDKKGKITALFNVSEKSNSIEFIYQDSLAIVPLTFENKVKLIDLNKETVLKELNVEKPTAIAKLKNYLIVGKLNGEVDIFKGEKLVQNIGEVLKLNNQEYVNYIELSDNGEIMVFTFGNSSQIFVYKMKN